MIEIKTKCCGEVICSGETVRAALLYARHAGISMACANLRRLNLMGLVLRGIDFREADLSQSNLKFCRLQDCDFRGAILAGTNFSLAKVNHAKMGYVNWRRLNPDNFRGG